jgi:hypothetical protein
MKENEMLSLKEFKSLFVNQHQSAFEELFKNEELYKTFRKGESGVFHEQTKRAKETPTLRFSRINKDSRFQFRREIGKKFISVFEADLIPYLKEETNVPLTILFHDTFQRKLAHSVCDYYSLLSESFDTKDGERVVVIRKTIESKMVADVLLSDFLQISMEDVDLMDGEISYKILNYSHNNFVNKKSSKKTKK